MVSKLETQSSSLIVVRLIKMKWERMKNISVSTDFKISKVKVLKSAANVERDIH